MAKKVPNSTVIGKLRLLNFVLAFALVGMIALVVSHAALPAGFVGAQEQEIVSLTNKARAAKSLSPLQHIECLNKVAENWAKTMAIQNNMYHNPNGGSDITAACGGAWATRGENVSHGFGGSVDRMFDAWMASKGYYDSKGVYHIGHYDNIAGSTADRFTKIGVGAYRDATGDMWWVQVFARCSTCTTTWSNSATVGTALDTYGSTAAHNKTGIPYDDMTKYNYQTESTPSGDAYFIKRAGTVSGNVEINCLTAASAHTVWSGARVTALPLSDLAKYNVQLQVSPVGDLDVIRRSNTPSGMVEVGRLTAASGYKTWAWDKPTVIPVADVVKYSAQLQIASAGDLFYIKTIGTSSNTVQVDRLTLASDYKTWSYNRTTSVPSSDATKYNYQIQVMGNGDLTFIKRQNTAVENRVEVGRLSLSSGLKEWAFVAYTPLQTTLFSTSRLQITVAQNSDLMYVTTIPSLKLVSVGRVAR